MSNAMTAPTHTAASYLSPRHAQTAVAALAALERAGGTVRAAGHYNATALQQWSAMLPPFLGARLRTDSILPRLEQAGLVAVEYMPNVKPPRPVSITLTGADRTDVEQLASEAPSLTERMEEQARKARIGTPATRAVVRALHANGGAVRDSNGRATSALLKLTEGAEGAPTVGSIIGVTRTLAESGWLTVERNEKRSYAYTLTGDWPREWVSEDLADEPEPEPDVTVSEPEPEEVEDVPEPEPLPEPEDVSTSNVAASDVAFALLDLVLKRATEAVELPAALELAQGQLEDAQSRLAKQVEYGAVLRRRLDAAEDETKAVKLERDTLRSRLRSVESNLSALMRESGAATTAAYRDGIQRALDGFMRKAPNARA